MKKQIIRAAAAGLPAGPYSQAVAVGDWLFVSGEKGVDPGTGEIVQGGVKAQARQALVNIKAVLEAAGSSLHDVVRCVVYLADSEQFEALNEAYADFFPSDPPARSTVIVAGLPMHLQVLIEATAIRGCGT
ncbi:MAG: Rid family detoxifying hydrolase [Thermodesulfobacteriota bacterium]